MNNDHLDHHSLFEYVYSFAPIGIALVSIEGHVLRANPALCRLLGYSEKELQSRTFQDLTHPDDLDSTVQGRQQVLNGEITSFSLTKKYLHKQGNLIWASLHTSVVHDDVTGTPLYFISHIIDITEKRKTEELYQLISENAQEVIYCSTLEGICYYCSPSIREVLGYEPAELIGQPGRDLIHPDDFQEMMKSHSESPPILRYRNRHKDGQYVWFETTYKIIEDNEGNQNVLAVGRDITERKQNEDLLEEAQAIASIGSWDWDIGLQTVHLSDQIFEILQIDRSVDTKFQQPCDLLTYIQPDDHTELISRFETALTSRRLDFEARTLQEDEAIRYLHIRGIVTADDQNRPIRMNGTIQDITEWKKMENKLLETVERYTSLKKYNHDAVISLDLKGNIFHGNAMAEQLTGYSISELAGQSASILIGAEHLHKILSESVHNASIENEINHFLHRSGKQVEVLTTVAPIVIKSEIAGFYLIAKDITEQKKLIIAKEAAERTNKTKNEFLAMLSHEIRTPMNGVLGMADLLSDATNLEPEQKEYLEVIRKSGNILLTIINDILDFSKIESGQTQLTEHIFDIRECISETFDLLSTKAQAKQLKMVSSVSHDIPSEVVGDPERLKQILMNLVGNAIKFTDAGGVTVSAYPAGAAELEFKVEDTGIGIPPHEIGRLFEPFQQLKNQRHRNSEGTGLGLAISKKLVELMGGSIRIEPSDGPGSTLLFTIPFRTPAATESWSTKHEEPDALPVSLQILVAEDNVINQRVIKLMLEKLGHSVTLAEDGQEAVKLAADGSYDVIFMDVYMPIMDGFEATQMIKTQLPQGKRPFIVAMTANALLGDREKCLEAGMDEYISKPIKMEMVSRVLRQFV
jgi:PAS domain S-box-containing protein